MTKFISLFLIQYGSVTINIGNLISNIMFSTILKVIVILVPGRSKTVDVVHCKSLIDYFQCFLLSLYAMLHKTAKYLPCYWSVIEALKDLNAQGLEVNVSRKDHSFLKHCFARPSLDTIWGYLQLISMPTSAENTPKLC